MDDPSSKITFRCFFVFNLLLPTTSHPDLLETRKGISGNLFQEPAQLRSPTWFYRSFVASGQKAPKLVNGSGVQNNIKKANAAIAMSQLQTVTEAEGHAGDGNRKTETSDSKRRLTD